MSQIHKLRSPFQLRSVHNAELSAICQQLLSLQSSMAKEKARLQSILDEKDDHISSQRSELDRLNLLITGGAGKKKKRESSPKVEAPPCKAAQGQAHQRPHAVGGSTLDRHRPPGSSAAAVGSGGGVRIHGSSFRCVAFDFINETNRLFPCPLSPTTDM